MRSPSILFCFACTLLIDRSFASLSPSAQSSSIDILPSTSSPSTVLPAASEPAMDASSSLKDGHIEEHIDAATGKKYYINHLSKSTSWEDPRLASSISLPSPWEASYLSDGRMFFTNHTSRSTEWRHPERLLEMRAAGILPQGDFDRAQHPELEVQHSGFWVTQSLENGEKRGEESWRQFVLPVVADRGEKKGQTYWVDYKLNTASWDSPQDVYDRMLRCEATNLMKASVFDQHDEL